MTKQIQGVLFDVDGTLIDTAVDLIASLDHALLHYGYNACDADAARAAASHGSLTMVYSALPDEKDEIIKNVQQALLQQYKKLNGERGKLFTGMPQVIDFLTANNIPFGVVTNKPARFCRPLMKKLGLLNQMKSIVSGDSTLYAKPHSAPMLLAAQQIDCNPENILYVGDAERDIQAANNTNMQSVVAMWGYLSKTDNPNSWYADHLLQNPIDLLALFKI